MERYRTLEAIVIGRKALPSGDLFLRLVGPEGSLEAVARKAQRPSGRSGRLSLFYHIRFQLYQKPSSDLATLTQAELVGRLEGLEAPKVFPYACFLAELAYRLASPAASERIWPLLSAGLRGIAKQPDPRLPLVWAGWRMVKAAGLAPRLKGEGVYLDSGALGNSGIFLGEEGVKALADILILPGLEAVNSLQEAPLDRLLQALRVHVSAQVGELKSALLLRTAQTPKSP